MSRTVSETASFEFHAGFTISMGASFKAGIPWVSEGEIGQILVHQRTSLGERPALPKRRWDPQWKLKFLLDCPKG